MICLTFDTDWMTPDSLARFIAEFPIPGKATFFAHTHFPGLYATKHEICPHPFIDNLNTWQDGLAELVSRSPRKPTGVRPHSCVFSHMVGIGLHTLGYRYISQAQNIFQTNLAPFRHPWGVWELPIYYMDNMDFWMPKNWPEAGHVPFDPKVIRNALAGDALFVFDVHPLHIALNTRTHEDYVAVKDRIINDGVSPFDLKFPGRGVRTFFESLCEEMTKQGVVSASCSDALDHYGCK